MFKVQTNKLFPNYVFLLSVVTSKSPMQGRGAQVSIISDLKGFQGSSFIKISIWKAYKCSKTLFVSLLCIRSRVGPVWSRLSLTQAVSCASRDLVRINIQPPVSGVTSEDQCEASAELHHPIRGHTCYQASPLMVLREGADTQHCLGLRVEISQKTVLSQSYLHILK